MYRARDTVYWRTWDLQNHQWVSVNGLAAAGFALLDDPESASNAKNWLAFSLAKFRNTEAIFPPDGALQEGLNYWSLGVDALLKFWHLAGEQLHEVPTSPWWALTGYYRLYLSLPREAWTMNNKVVDFADCMRFDWVGPDYLLQRLAAINHDAQLQWLANELAAVTEPDRFSACWLNLVWHDAMLASKPPSTLPTMRHFADLGIVSARSDWSGRESLLAFKCGPALGHNATTKLDYDPGASHAHPDANHFVLFGAGEWLIRDDGYRYKMADQHNTLLIDGKGQIGEDAYLFINQHEVGEKGMWFSAIEQIRTKSHPRVTAAASTPQMDYIVGDAAEAYPQESGLRRFERRVIFLKPDIVIVVDDVETDRPRDLEMRFHTENAIEDRNGAFTARGEKAILRLEPLTKEGVEVSAGDLPCKDYLRPAKAMGLGRGPGSPTMHTLRLATRSAHWRIAVALSWSPVGAEPARISLEKSTDHWTFRMPGRIVEMTWDGVAPKLISEGEQ